MSIAKLNEDYLFYQKEDCSIRNTNGISQTKANLKRKNAENQNNKTSNILKSDSITELINFNNIKLNKNSEKSHVSKNERFASKGKTIENNNASKIKQDLYEDDSLSQMERKSPNNFYGNFESLINEDDNIFSFESFNRKTQDFQAVGAKNIFSENTSVIAEDNYSSNLINNHNSNSITGNLNPHNKRNLNDLKAKNNNCKNTEKKMNLGNFNFNNSKNKINHKEKIFCNYNYNFIDNENRHGKAFNPNDRNDDSSNNNNNYDENLSFNSILDSNEISNSIHDDNRNINQVNINRRKFVYCEEKRMGKWSDEEDKILYELVPLYGAKNWKKIAESIQGRSPIQCLHRWTKILQPGLVKGPWTIEEDRKLLEWVKKEGPVKWTQCSEFIKGRNGKQCRERWFHTLNPKVVKGNWNTEEDLKIFSLYKKLGGKWSKIARSIPGRTENSIKNRFYSTLRRKAVEQAKTQSAAKINSDFSSNSAENANCGDNGYSSYKAKKTNNQLSNFGSHFTLEELLDFLPQALLEVKIKYMKEFNLTAEDLVRKEYEILQGGNSRDQKIQADYLNEKLYEDNIFNKQANINPNFNSITNNSAQNQNPQMINLNVNFNSNHNNYIVGNDKIGIKNNEIINFPNPTNFNNPNPLSVNKNNSPLEHNQNVIFKDRIPILKEENIIPNNNTSNFNNNENHFKFDFCNQLNDYKNMDIFSLENNIIDMCDNPNFMYSDNNLGFLDNQVDHIIDSMFLNNNIILTNDNERDCDMCFMSNNNQNDKKQAKAFNEEKKDLKPESLLSHQRNEVSNEKADQTIKTVSDKDASLNNFKMNPINELSVIGSKNEFEPNVKVEEKNNLQQPIKKHVLSSLISQLEDLEKLVKNTKKELMKYNEKGDNEGSASEEAIFSTVNLTNTIQKLFK